MELVEIINGIIAREGSIYTNRAADAGGPTKYGITLDTLSAYRGHQCSAADVQALTAQDATQIYSAMYVTKPGFDRITDPDLEALLVDAAVQHGSPVAVRMLQTAAGVTADGNLGEASLAAVNGGDAQTLFFKVCAARVRLYGSLIAHDPQLQKAESAGFALQAENALGWANRIAAFIEGNA